jgi:hypothetical protein
MFFWVKIYISIPYTNSHLSHYPWLRLHWINNYFHSFVNVYRIDLKEDYVTCEHNISLHTGVKKTVYVDVYLENNL